ncbi:MAG TPA: hypothetical protein VGG10_06685 [Rhizomicrobium sp.]
MLTRARFLMTVFAAGSFGACTLCVSTSASADPTTGRYLSDPAYLPLAGEFDGSTAFTVGDTHSKTYNSATNALIASIGQHTDQFAQMLEYGITDDLSIQASMDYDVFDKRTRFPVGGPSESLYSSGITDPSFGITWRALDQMSGPSPMNLDLFGSYSPDWLGDTQPALGATGTEGRGGQEGRIGAALSHVWDTFTLYGSASANFIGDRNIFDSASHARSVANGYTNWTLDLSGQYRFTDQFSANAGVGETFGANTDVLNGATGVDHVNDPGDNTSIHASLNYAMIPDTLVAQATYAHNDYGTAHINFPAAAASDQTTRDHDENVWGLKLNYAFQ